jgi:hypothetical protein
MVVNNSAPEPDGSHEHSLIFANHQGRRAGRSRKCSASDCPYRHGELALRFAWMDGFSKGRILLKEAEGTSHRVRVDT